MGLTIDAVAVTSGGFLQARSARRMADTAATDCLGQLGIAAGDIELLVNAGLYRERNLGEPAFAAMIQEDIGANPSDPYAGGRGTFSFDVANGACGVLSGLQIADGFLAADTVRRAMVVASDTSPTRGRSGSFPFAPAGGAAVCGYTSEAVGLVGIRWELWPDAAGLFSSALAFEGGRHVLAVETDPEFDDRAGACAAKAAAALLAEHELAPEAVDVVIANPLRPAFLDALAGYLGVTGDRLVHVDGADRIHTPGLLVALRAAIDRGRLSTGLRALLVSAGAGVVAGAALLLT
jgi:3-oxoacyl-[acyl-carrier-protein] synthase-3